MLAGTGGSLKAGQEKTLTVPCPEGCGTVLEGSGMRCFGASGRRRAGVARPGRTTVHWHKETKQIANTRRQNKHTLALEVLESSLLCTPCYPDLRWLSTVQCCMHEYDKYLPLG